MSNKERHPRAWVFYIEQARNISEEADINHLGKYRIPEPNQSGRFIYAETVEQLWLRFITTWYQEDLKSESVRGKIQYIVNNF